MLRTLSTPNSAQEHPVSCLFVGSRGHLPDIVTAARLRATSKSIRDAFTIAELRTRLANSLSRDGDGINTQQLQLLRFDLGMGELMVAMWIAEEGGRWDETGEVLQLASHCRYCTLPIMFTSTDINTHVNKTAYGSVARMLAQLMVVGRHIDFGDGSCLQIFRRANGEVRAIRDEPGFRLDVDPPLAADHLYQRHRLQHDPSVRSDIYYSGGTGRWMSGCVPDNLASLSSFAKFMILQHFFLTHQTNNTSIRRVGGGRLDDLLTQSPHTPVAGCSTTFSYDDAVRFLVLTDSSHNFVVRMAIWDLGNTVRVTVHTTEAPAAGVTESGAFKDRFPVTTQLSLVALGQVAPYVFDGQVDDDIDDDDDSDGHGGGWDDMDDGSDGEDSGGDNASAEEENGE
ncbi:unnamed protein product [Vitrella brassicaformis CCMP3155]|uniref:Uncharacterized protein n=1 Tax=Vitrella brassicaformis (strain CCMP3155) TaxID=1169540 RepID=A0A0G4GYK2_VITBC|nr:unnamed protein product [Vitrella brassicaformis CCMP3155]|eukprot:CEM36232.1 unnamed protein product [Vitrella brassicaformis CCMP3155]